MGAFDKAIESFGENTAVSIETIQSIALKLSEIASPSDLQRALRVTWIDVTIIFPKHSDGRMHLYIQSVLNISEARHAKKISLPIEKGCDGQGWVHSIKPSNRLGKILRSQSRQYSL